MWLIVSFTTARKCFVMLSYQSVKFFFYFEILKVVFFPPVSRASSNVQNCHWRILFLVPSLPSTTLHHSVIFEIQWKLMCNWFYFPIKKKTTFTCYIEVRCVCSHSSCTYQIENKAEGCSILFATSPASACPPSSLLHSAACCWLSSGSFQRGSRDSLGCQMSDLSGLRAEVFFSVRVRGRPMHTKTHNWENQNVKKENVVSVHINGAFIASFLELQVVRLLSWQSSMLYPNVRRNCHPLC